MLHSTMAEDPNKPPRPPSDPLPIARALDLEIGRQRDMVEAMNTVCGRLGAALTRWIGDDGWQALLRRAVAETAQPNGGGRLKLDELGELHWTDPRSDDPDSRFQPGPSPPAEPIRSDEVRDTCIRVLETVVSLLERFVGADLARRIAAEGFVRTVVMRDEGSDHG